MNKNLKWLGLGGFLAIALLFAVDLPAYDSKFGDDLFYSCMENVKKDCQSWALKGGGSEAPRGLTSDSKAELAIGERYILTGSISIFDNLPYLRISFNDHAWLASRLRLSNPYYRIHDDASRWKRYRGKDVTIVVTARYTTWSQGDGRMTLEILLDPMEESIIDAIQPRTRRN